MMMTSNLIDAVDGYILFVCSLTIPIGNIRIWEIETDAIESVSNIPFSTNKGSCDGISKSTTVSQLKIDIIMPTLITEFY